MSIADGFVALSETKRIRQLQRRVMGMVLPQPLAIREVGCDAGSQWDANFVNPHRRSGLDPVVCCDIRCLPGKLADR